MYAHVRAISSSLLLQWGQKPSTEELKLFDLSFSYCTSTGQWFLNVTGFMPGISVIRK